LALQQNAQGADFIAGLAAVGDFGVFEAAKEKGFYSSGQDVDRTVIDPEHVILSQLKEVDTVTHDTVKLFVEDKFDFGTTFYGLAEGGVGLTFVTTDSESPRSEKLTDEDIAQLKEIAEGIKAGTIDTSITK
ncbi:MAG TPA: BMP family ABC transporter substrate-binding protein, partial [Candidatus Paenibacillus intestinavium]|nr:BMP family ABC transporter substrate-binding protein [Candidatus Paenibacillus intestinavium]